MMNTHAFSPPLPISPDAHFVQDDGRDTARTAIADLVQRYSNTPRMVRAGYNEDQLRHAYILPLFRALGWNTEDPAEMTAEEQISKGFVDFGFYIGGIPSFYVETKRVKAGVERPEFTEQAINYAYLKGVTWSILTDFENLIAFNAEYRYEQDQRPPAALQLRFEEFAEGGFDDLWMLSKAQMRLRPRPLDVRAERQGIRNRRRPVTELLFEDLTRWRSDIFKQMRTYSPPLFTQNPALVDNAVQRLLDRLIFIRTAEDRLIEPPILQAIHRQHPRAMWWPMLRQKFRELDGVYNSNLFAESEVDAMDIHDADLIKRIIEGLYSRAHVGGAVTYDFSAISADVLGRVYEQYLGFRTSDPQGKKVATGPLTLGRKQVRRREQGIFYTPEYVVRYIVRRTVGRLLAQPHPPTPSPFNGEGEKSVLNGLHGRDPLSLRIVDPACGSGSFLIGAFDLLDAAMSQRHPKASDDERRAWRRRILTECLYGVDLDEQAVEVTRLNLLLRAAQERGKLPLLVHIQAGNSVVDDVGQDPRAFDWAARFPDVMRPVNEGGRGGFDAVIGNPPYVRGELLTAGFKEWAASPLSTGGRPRGVAPTNGQEGEQSAADEAGLVPTNTGEAEKPRYETAAGSADLYVYFIERGVKLLNDGGIYGVIVANRWLRAGYGQNLRKWLKPYVDEVVDFGELPVFQDAATFPAIVIARRNETADSSVIAAQVKTLAFNDLDTYLGTRRYDVPRDSLTAKGWSLAGVSAEAVLAKMKMAGVPLDQYVQNAIHRGVVTGYNEAFVINETTRNSLIARDLKSADVIKPFVFGRDIKRYARIQNVLQYVIFFPRGKNPDDYPVVRDYLLPFKERLTPKPADHVGTWKGRKAGRYQWWESQDPVNYHQKFEQSKIVYPDIAMESRFTYDVNGTYLDSTMFFIPTDDLYLFGVFASKAAFFFLSKVAAVLGDAEKGGRLRLKRQYVRQLPIPKLDLSDAAQKAQHDQVVAMVERMLALKQRQAAPEMALSDERHVLAEQIAGLDRDIDQAVYRLYGLTAEEIAVMEGQSPSPTLPQWERGTSAVGSGE